MKFVIAFFMAWGNFITLPCPYKRWDNQLKNMMLAFLPLVGLVIGAIWVLVLWCLKGIPLWCQGIFQIPDPLAGAIGVFSLFALCGFMHLDGFMDCSDAIMSRRPLEERQRILKDSTVGAFAVVMVVFLLMIWFACMTSCWKRVPLGELLLIPVISRFGAGLAVQTYKPIGHSQYRKDYGQRDKWKWKLMSLVLFLVILGGTQIPCLLAGNYEVLSKTLALVVAMLAATKAEGTRARKQLGGMSGDIAGDVICCSELTGIILLTCVS